MSTTRPKVHIVATGGSISGIGPDRLDYLLYPELGNRLSIEEMLERIPEVETVAQVQGENLIRVGSPAIGPPEWLQLAHRINDLLSTDPELAGVVVTHGTATLEETAYFLHLTVKSDRPGIRQLLRQTGCDVITPIVVADIAKRPKHHKGQQERNDRIDGDDAAPRQYR